MEKTFFVVALVITLSGCTPRTWVRPDATQVETSQDRYACMQQAAAMFPPQIVTTQAQPAPEGQMVDGHYVKPSITQYLAAAMPTSYDANESGRKNAFSECMQSRGYTYKRAAKDQ